MLKPNESSEKMKPASVTFKTTPKIKAALEKLAKDNFRSLSMQVEMIAAKYLEEQGIEWKEKPEKKS
jgi:hypothetical protein